jgi:cell division protein ZipA
MNGCEDPQLRIGNRINAMRQTILHLAAVATGALAMGCGGASQRHDDHPTLKEDKGEIRVGAGDREFVLVPSSASEARAAALLPTKASENVSHLLARIDMPEIDKLDPKAKEYLPREKVEWVVTVEFPGNPRINPKKVEQQFDAKWRAKFGGFASFGLDCDSGSWTFAIAKDGPRAISSLKLAWSYVAHIGMDPLEPSGALFEKRLVEVSEKLKSFGALRVVPSLPPMEAAQQAKRLRMLRSKLDQSAVLVLKAAPGQRFDGKKVWDVMLCLGLKWGDMDCFHWVNPTDQGDSYFFSVETSTPPGYFLPEEIAAGRVHVADLRFEFSIPRCRAPLQVFNAMHKAVEYCQRRLQGQILGEDGKNANIPAIRGRIAEIQGQLQKAGFVPGGHDTLMLF